MVKSTTDGRCLLIIHEEAGSIADRIISHVPSDYAGELELGIPCNQRHNRIKLIIIRCIVSVTISTSNGCADICVIEDTSGTETLTGQQEMDIGGHVSPAYSCR